MVSKGKDNLDRWEKVKSRTSHMDTVGESYNPIVPSKQANEGPQSRRRREYRPEESDQERGVSREGHSYRALLLKIRIHSQ